MSPKALWALERRLYHNYHQTRANINLEKFPSAPGKWNSSMPKERKNLQQHWLAASTFLCVTQAISVLVLLLNFWLWEFQSRVWKKEEELCFHFSRVSKKEIAPSTIWRLCFCWVRGVRFRELLLCVRTWSTSAQSDKTATSKPHLSWKTAG